MTDSALVIMAKTPVPGAVKTRLCPPLTHAQAAELYSCLLRDKIAQVASVPDAEMFIAVAQPWDEDHPVTDHGRGIILQRGADLGERLCACAEDLFGMGFAHVLLVDSDSPTLPPRYFGRALSMLADEDAQVVLGPTFDGGYYLIGLSSPCRALFEDIPWSTSGVLSRTLERAATAAVTTALLPVWYDVDDEADLIRLARELQDPVTASNAPHTAAWLSNWSMPEQQEEARIPRS